MTNPNNNPSAAAVFVTLTEVRDRTARAPLLLNAAEISSADVGEHGRTRVRMRDGRTYHVEESVPEVDRNILAASIGASRLLWQHKGG